MRPITGRSVAMSLCLAGLVLAAGCAANSGRATARRTYRTVQTDPLRETDVAKRYASQGLAHLDAGRLDEAEQAFREALAADVEHGPAHNNLGKVYYQQQDWYQAAWEFEYARKLMPNRPEPRNNLGLVLEQVGKLDDAVNHFREAVGLAPDNIRYRANLARALIRRGDRTEEVRVLLQQILDQDTRPQWLIWAKQQLIRMDAPLPTERD